MRRDGKPLHWNDEFRHRAAFASDPELYTLLAFAEGIHPWQQARILFMLLTQSHRDLALAERDRQERIVLFLLTSLSVEKVLAVFLAVRRARANHRHTSQAILSYLLQHPDIETLVQTRPRAIKDCLEHALGARQWRYFAYHAPRLGLEAPVPALLRRYGGSEALCRRLADRLYFGKAKPTAASKPPEIPWNPAPVMPGVLTQLLHLFYRLGTSPALVRQLEAAVEVCASGVPELPFRIALVLDASASMRGNGPQEFAPIALAVAFERVLQANCSTLRLYTIGGFGWPPAPEGQTDFGRAVLDALEGDPELVVVVTDGYENVDAGDAGRILATLHALGLTTPVVCCRIETDMASSVSENVPPNHLPGFPMRDERDFAVAMQIIGLLIAPQAARERVITGLRERQDRWEMEVYQWTAAS